MLTVLYLLASYSYGYSHTIKQDDLIFGNRFRSSDYRSDKVHHEKRALYETYENCLLNFTSAHWDLTRNPYNQLACLTELSEAEQYDPTELFRLHPVESPKFQKELPPQCTVGAEGKYLPSTTMFPEIVPNYQCHSLSYADRGIGRVWRDAKDSDSAEFIEGAQELLSLTRKIGANRIIFVGDSINTQLYRQLLCDSFREGSRITMEDSEDFDNLDRKHNLLPVYFPGNTEDPFIVEKHRSYWPGCDEDADGGDTLPSELLDDDEIRRRVRAELAAFSQAHERSADEKVVMFINVGLHRRDSREAKVSVVAREMLSFAEDHKHNTMVIFRETLAQHFSYSIDGGYGMHNLLNIEEMPEVCCGPIVDKNMTMYDIDLKFRRVFARDDDWTNKIGWVRTFEATSKMHDLHLELTSRSTTVDCTHWLYSPFMMSVVWIEMQNEIKRMADVLGW